MDTASSPVDYTSIMDLAHARGIQAGRAALPEPMNITDGKQTWIIPEGACGFAWVSIKGNSPFGRYARLHGFTKGYPSGLQLWVSFFNQSVIRKEAYAEAYAEVLRSFGIDAHAHSRLD